MLVALPMHSICLNVALLSCPTMNCNALHHNAGSVEVVIWLKERASVPMRVPAGLYCSTACHKQLQTHLLESMRT